MTKTDKTGYTAPISIPEVVREIDAFAKGVASVNSEAKVYVEWVGDLRRFAPHVFLTGTVWNWSPIMTDKELREIYYFEPNVVGELPARN